MKLDIGRPFLAAGLLGLAVAGCGLKGPLELPEPSTNVVIRGPQQAPATTAPPETPAGTAPTTRPGSTAVPAPKDDRMPPPPLPGGNPGS